MKTNEAIRKYCLKCCMSAMEVDKCKIKTCSFYKFKSGVVKGKFLPAINKKCKDCCDKNEECIILGCPLYEYKKHIN